MKYPDHFETERLTLRPITTADVAPWITFMKSSEALRYFPGCEPKDAEENAEKWVQNQLKRYGEGTKGLLALIDKESGAFVGQCGLIDQVVEDEPVLEIGYALLPESWGKGYATEAAKFLRNLAFKNDLAEQIVSLIHVDNMPSQAVAKRNGMRPLRNATWKEMPIIVFGISKAEFLAIEN